MTTLQAVARFCASAEFLNLFAVGVAVIVLNVVCRYIDKFRVIAAQSTPADRAQVHFDIWRVGSDLAVVGLLALFGVVQLVIPKTQTQGIPDLVAALLTLVVVEVVILLGVILALLVYDTPRKGFYRGILIPNAIGLSAVIVSVGFFRFWAR